MLLLKNLFSTHGQTKIEDTLACDNLEGSLDVGYYNCEKDCKSSSSRNRKSILPGISSI